MPINEPGKYTCEICGEKFRTKYNYNYHLKEHKKNENRNKSQTE